MVNKWLESYFTKSVCDKINKDKELKQLLISGIDVDGSLVVTKRTESSEEYIDFIKIKKGMAVEYGTLILAFFSGKLYCDSVNESLEECKLYLKEKRIIFGQGQGSILLGALNENKPIIAGMLITEATEKIVE